MSRRPITFRRMVVLFLMMVLSTPASAVWQAKTDDWSKNPSPVIGDWGFDRPGYPKGLYLHELTMPEG